jgi:hypothetical protein
MKRAIIGILLFLLFFITGFISYRDFFDVTIPDVKGVTFINVSFTEVSFNILVYCLTIGFIPICCMIIWRNASIHTIRKKILTVLIILICIIIGTFVGAKITLAKAISIRAWTLEKSLNKSLDDYPRAGILTENYMFLGLVVGSIAAYFLLRKKEKSSPMRVTNT